MIGMGADDRNGHARSMAIDDRASYVRWARQLHSTTMGLVPSLRRSSMRVTIVLTSLGSLVLFCVVQACSGDDSSTQAGPSSGEPPPGSSSGTSGSSGSSG